MKAPAPPSHLSASSKAWWRTVVRDFELEEHHLRLLQGCCELWDRGQEARRQIATDGLVVRNRYGASVAHPAVGIERDAKAGFLRLLRQLGLESEPESSASARARHAAESRWSHSPRRVS